LGSFPVPPLAVHFGFSNNWSPLSQVYKYSTRKSNGEMDLKSVVKKLEEKFPLRFAEKWDNVGLLTEPSKPLSVNTLFLTNDLTERVLEEAIDLKTNLILSYHPPIFSALKRLTTREVKERIIIRAIEERIAIYSPHTAVDSAYGGVNDWLANGLGELASSEVLQSHSEHAPGISHKFVVYVPQTHVDQLREELGNIGLGTIGNYKYCSFSTDGTGSFFGNENANPAVGKKQLLEKVPEVKLEMVCGKSSFGAIESVIKRVHPYETAVWEIHPLEPTVVAHTGQGRVVTLKEPVKLSKLIERIKSHLELPHIRLALPLRVTNAEDVQIKTVALCAGAGFEVIGKAKADLYLTGEMRHHDVLAAVEKGTTVILCEHTNTERGYLKVLKNELDQLLQGKVNIVVSQRDADPLVVV